MPVLYTLRILVGGFAIGVTTGHYHTGWLVTVCLCALYVCVLSAIMFPE